MILKTFEKFKSSEIEKILASAEEFLLDKKHWKDEYGEWHINGSLDIPKEWIYKGRLIVPIYEIDDINLEGCGLTTLEGCPQIVHRDCSVVGNKLTNLKGSPKKILNFYVSQNNLTSLEGSPEYVNVFYFHINPLLSSLENAPKINVDYYSPINDRTLISDVETNFYFYIKGFWSNYYLDLLKYIMKNHEENFEEIIKTVKGWPDGFLTNDLIQSLKGTIKFNL